MKQERVNRVLFPPVPVVLVGTMIDNKPNFMTVGWCIPAKVSPPLISIGINSNHYTDRGIAENKTFSVSIPDSNLIEKTDYCGIVSGKDNDKSKLFSTFTGELGTAPMIEECPVNMECKLVETVDVMHYHLFIGEIINTYAKTEMVEDGKIIRDRLKTMLLTQPDNNYWQIGPNIGKAWKEGLKLKS